jgi:hypothetical protein
MLKADTEHAWLRGKQTVCDYCNCRIRAAYDSRTLFYQSADATRLLTLGRSRNSASAWPRRCGLRHLCVMSPFASPVHHREPCAGRNAAHGPVPSSTASPRSKFLFKRTCSACEYQRACQNTQCRCGNALPRPVATPAPKHKEGGHLQPAAHGTHVVGLAITAWKWSNWWSASATTFLVAVRVENICAERACRASAAAHARHTILFKPSLPDPARTVLRLLGAHPNPRC